MYERRLPFQTPRPIRPRLELPADAPRRVAMTGRLVGAEGSTILELLHLEIAGADQLAEQLALTKLVDQRVNITVELVDEEAALHEMAASQDGEYDPVSGTMLMEGEAI